MSLFRPKLEYASCLWSLFYDVRVDKAYTIYSPYFGLDGYLRSFCALLRLDTLVKRRFVTYIMFLFDILSGINLNAPRY
jgi:hypothetical protein